MHVNFILIVAKSLYHLIIALNISKSFRNRKNGWQENT